MSAHNTGWFKTQHLSSVFDLSYMILRDANAQVKCVHLNSLVAADVQMLQPVDTDLHWHDDL